MTKRPTLNDLARTAGVGTATVDRVLNGRANVRDSTVRRVLKAAEEIGYPTVQLLQRHREAGRRSVRFGFVLHKPSQEFDRTFASELSSAVADRKDVRGTCDIRFSTSQAPDDFARELREVAKTSDVIATSAINHPSLTVHGHRDATWQTQPRFGRNDD